MTKTMFFTLMMMFGLMICNSAIACDPSCPDCYGGENCDTNLCNNCQYCSGGKCVYAGIDEIYTTPEPWCVGEYGDMGVLTSPSGFRDCIEFFCDGDVLYDQNGDLVCAFTTAGEHDIYVCTPDDYVVVPMTIVGVGSVTADRTACCANDNNGIVFTATANPAGKQMRCIRWQYRYSVNVPNLNSLEWSGTFGYGETSVRLVPGGWAGPGYYQFRALNGKPDYDDAWAASPVVKVIPRVSRIEIEYIYDNWSDITEQSITLLKGTKYTFRAVPSSGQWIENLPTWTGVGTGSGEIIEVTFADTGTFTLTATAADCGEKMVDIEVVEPQVYRINFNGDHALFLSASNEIWGDGMQAISDPVYNVESGKNDPFCVTKNSSNITAGVVLKVFHFQHL